MNNIVRYPELEEALSSISVWLPVLRDELRGQKNYLERIAVALEVISKDVLERKKDIIRL